MQEVPEDRLVVVMRTSVGRNLVARLRLPVRICNASASRTFLHQVAAPNPHQFSNLQLCGS